MNILLLCAACAVVCCPTVVGAADAAGLAGGVGLTRLTVYEQRTAPDGTNSGSPHVHALTDEAYYVISGTGRAELHDLRSGFRSVELKPGQYLQFPPCVMHRIVSTGGLTILAVMGNAGLAERGDARIYFGAAVDADSVEYSRLAGLAAKGLDGALNRRDAAVRAYSILIELWNTNRPAYYAELRRFITAYLSSAAKNKDAFAPAVASGPKHWGEVAQARLDRLPGEGPETDTVFSDGEAAPTLGMCGVLKPVTAIRPLAGSD